MNYKGMMQLKEPEIISNDKLSHFIPGAVINKLSIVEINQIPLSEDITVSLLLYSQNSGGDFT